MDNSHTFIPFPDNFIPFELRAPIPIECRITNPDGSSELVEIDDIEQIELSEHANRKERRKFEKLKRLAKAAASKRK